MGPGGLLLDMKIEDGDIVAWIGEADALNSFAKEMNLIVNPRFDQFADSLSPHHSGLAEMVVTPTSPMVGESARELGMRSGHGVSTLAIIRSDGTMVRDYFYVEDSVEAFLQLAEWLAVERSLAGEAFNFSNEQPVSVTEVVRQVLTLMGQERLEPIIQNRATHEIPRQHLDAVKARERLGWRAQFDLEEGLRRTIAWYQQFLNAEAVHH